MVQQYGTVGPANHMTCTVWYGIVRYRIVRGGMIRIIWCGIERDDGVPFVARRANVRGSMNNFIFFGHGGRDSVLPLPPPRSLGAFAAKPFGGGWLLMSIGAGCRVPFGGDMVWYGYGMVLYGMVRYDAIWYYTIRYGTTWYMVRDGTEKGKMSRMVCWTSRCL